MASSSSVKSNLNPNAPEWRPNPNPKPVQFNVEDRCLFITFSIGYPLDELEILRFMTSRYGKYVKGIDLHHGDGRYRHPVFGRIVFTEGRIPQMILQGRDQVLLKVNGKNLCCKRYRIPDDTA